MLITGVHRVKYTVLFERKDLLGKPQINLVIMLSKIHFVVFFKKWANPGLFFIYFQSFQTSNAIFTTKSM